jgi:hypothetical protein
LTEGAETDDIRDDVTPDELVSYCLHALTAASSLPSKAAQDQREPGAKRAAMSF